MRFCRSNSRYSLITNNDRYHRVTINLYKQGKRSLRELLYIFQTINIIRITVLSKDGLLNTQQTVFVNNIKLYSAKSIRNITAIWEY